jgi:hypothetical protein
MYSEATCAAVWSRALSFSAAAARAFTRDA